MSLTFPRKFVHGQMVGNADVQGELYLWPNGHFHYMVHTRNHDPVNGERINVSFALLDEKHVSLGTDGVPADWTWRVAPSGEQVARRYDELYGHVPEDKLKTTGAVALLFRPDSQELDAVRVQGLATLGSELLFCPTPD